MDPLEEIGLVGDILQFVQHSIGLLTASGELYRKVELEAQNIIAASIKQVHALATKAAEQCFASKVKIERTLNIEPNHASLASACRECLDVAAALHGALGKLFVPQNIPGRGWTSLRFALEGVWSKQDIGEQVKRLRAVRADIESRVLPRLSDKGFLASLSRADRFEELHSEMKDLITALCRNDATEPTGSQARVSALCLLMSRLEVVHLVNGRPSPHVVVDSYDAPYSKNHTVASVRQEEKKRRSLVSTQILDSLAFEATPQKPDDVPESHKNIFKQVLGDRNPESDIAPTEQWSDLGSWLRTGTGLYWIHGRRATGKTTMMKTIAGHEETDKLLQQWKPNGAGDAPLCLAKFFFSPSAPEEQRSQSGLYRSLLHEILRQVPALVPVLFPQEWSTSYCMSLGYKTALQQAEKPDSRSSYNAATQKFQWSEDSLKKAVELLFAQSQVPLRACIFIDGLDEYEGAGSDIAQLFGQTLRSENIKFCVSTKRSTVFESSFSTQAALPLERLTYPGMQRLAENQLRSNTHIRTLADADPETFHDFVDEIVTSAHGVFLWLHLATLLLVREQGVREGVAEMYTRLHRIPEELEELYGFIVKNIGAAHREESSRLFQLLIASSETRPDDWRVVSPLTLLGLSFAAEDHPSLAVSAQLHFLSPDDAKQRCTEMASKLRTVCGGLIDIQRRNGKEADVHATTTVGPVHSTFKDFLMSQEARDLLETEVSDSTFQPSLAILKSTVLLMKTEQHISSSDRFSYHHIDNGILYARRAEAEMGADARLGVVIDELVTIGGRWFRLNTLSQPVFHPLCTKYSVAAQCGLAHYLAHLLARDNIIPRENPQRTGKRTLLSLTLLPPAGFEPFVSPAVVETLIRFGADAGEAANLVVAFLQNWDPAARRPHLPAWRDLWMDTILPRLKRQDGLDFHGLRSVFGNSIDPDTQHNDDPYDWANFLRAMGASSMRLDQEARQKASSKPRRKFWFF